MRQLDKCAWAVLCCNGRPQYVTGVYEGELVKHLDEKGDESVFEVCLVFGRTEWHNIRVFGLLGWNFCLLGRVDWRSLLHVAVHVSNFTASHVYYGVGELMGAFC